MAYTDVARAPEGYADGVQDNPADRADSLPYAIVAVASSAGGITALGRLLGGLPKDFPVPIVMVQHLDPRHETIIADVLGRKTPLRVQLAAEGDLPQPGNVYIGPPNHHLLVSAERTLTLSSSELVHFVRPSADLLFKSVAASYGPQAIACVLTGTGSDGAAGATVIRQRGGMVIAEDPEHAEFKGMPGAVVAAGVVDFVLPLGEIAPAIRQLIEDGRL
jgi:two-component system, chemotaxis family, protein-glutamate methylesterase/glutaminase